MLKEEKRRPNKPKKDLKARKKKASQNQKGKNPLKNLKARLRSKKMSNLRPSKRLLSKHPKRPKSQ